MITKEFQKKLAAWQVATFGPREPWAFLLGVGEELAEFWRACELEDHAEQLDAIGDASVFLIQFVHGHGLWYDEVLHGPAGALCPRRSSYEPRLAPSQEYAAMAKNHGRLCRAVLKRAEGARGFEDDRRYLEVVRASCESLSLELLRASWRRDTDYELLVTMVASRVVARGFPREAPRDDGG